MAVVFTHKLTPGMVLKSAVKDITGRMLLGDGVTITEKHIGIFKTWGVTEVDIQGEVEEDSSDTASGSLDPQLFLIAENELKPLFAFMDLKNSAVSREIFRLAVLSKTGALRMT